VTPSHADCTNGNADALHTAICRSVKAGVTYAVAAGNSAADSTSFTPAGYEEVITVSALSDSDGIPGGTGGAPSCRTTERDDYFASFSNFGAPVDIAAPGVCILSTWLGGGYNTISGTSMATPHVTGAAALYIAANPGATPAQVKAGLQASATPGAIPGDPDPFKEGILHVP
jgi:subtilisin family serine protease